jgi:hypothetical protein
MASRNRCMTAIAGKGRRKRGKTMQDSHSGATAATTSKKKAPKPMNPIAVLLSSSEHTLSASADEQLKNRLDYAQKVHRGVGWRLKKFSWRLRKAG